MAVIAAGIYNLMDWNRDSERENDYEKRQTFFVTAN